ncbi:ABC transporter ATP-binding protein [Kineosporia succinea]|uniref:Teichoic acid transport system ATP-binding protein n=1 Tax=Kineosporia succinea TaxID=84632 RepID=A0ABT9P013_9ACTN|nr:ABC transporter ATP-binding protein [Kineosporia succinea]MDP9825425.1 teichoic acid transport system ATP-binding protein [Kineosporia succinea]
MTEQTSSPNGSVATGTPGEDVETKGTAGQDAQQQTAATPRPPVKKAPAKKAPAPKERDRTGLKTFKRRVPVGPRERPTVIVDNLHVTYKVYATGKAASGRNAEKKGLLARTPAIRRAREVHAVRGISFTAYEGDSIGLVGTNGSGKSTLCSAIAGLVPAAKGAVYSEANPTLLGVGAALMNELSGERNVILGGLALGMSLEEVRAKYDEIVEFSGLKPEFLDLPMRTYSQGMGARLRFAIAASVSHQVLMIDEALSVGDRQFQQRSESRIRDLREQAGTVFLVSHALPTITKTCNRVLWIDQGKLIMDGGVDEVITAYTESENAADDE